MSEDRSERPSGPVNGPHHLLKCSNCRAVVADVWVVGPDVPQTNYFVANCPWCGDRTFAEEVVGSFVLGGYGTLKEDDPFGQDVPSTILEDADVNDDGVWELVIKKANQHATPVYARS